MIVDSGPLVAALNRRDANHLLAVSLLQEAGPTARIPVPVLVETDHLTRSHRPSDPPVLRLVDALAAGEHHLEVVTQDVLEQAAGLDRRYVDLQLGLTDCTVAVLAARYGVPVLTFDFRDFRAITVEGRALDLVVSEADLNA